MPRWSGKLLKEAQECFNLHDSSMKADHDAETCLDNLMDFVETLDEIRLSKGIDIGELVKQRLVDKQ